MRRALALRRAMRNASSGYIVRDTNARTRGAPAAAPRSVPSGTPAIACRLLPRLGDIAANAQDATETPRGGTTAELPSGTEISAGDWLFIGTTRYRVVSAPPERPTDVYRSVEIEEVR